MNFFEHQDAARRKTGRLVVLFCLAVVGIIVGVYLVIVGAYFFFGDMRRYLEEQQQFDIWNPMLMASVGGITILVVGGASLYKIAQLGSGGSGIAESLGGRRLPMESNDLIERRLLNVVEEMAIASGVPTPPVYMMDRESGINAFAAGYSPGDAVIGVTRGCAERLSRDELQGVIAHEFSHILNGDMRLNIRLIGLLHGILVIGLVGYFVLRSAFYGAAYSGRSSRDRGNPLPLLAIGAGLIAVGSIGTFFGKWIKSAVSRQREYLADASAVQFTRDPNGIGGALKKIGGFTTGSKIANPNAPQLSHMFFGQALTGGLDALFATHPPLPKRIKRIDPSWNGEYLKSERVERRGQAEPQPSAIAGFAAEASDEARTAAPPDAKSGRRLEHAVEAAGRPTQQHLDYARALKKAIPGPLLAAAHEAYGARALIYAMLINRQAEPQRKQIEQLNEHADEGVLDATKKLLPSVITLEPDLRLPLIDVAIPALRELSAHQYEAFRRNMIELIKADDRMELFEWCLQRLLLHHLDGHFIKARPKPVKYYSLARLGPQLSQLLSTLAYVGHTDTDSAKAAFRDAAGRLAVEGMRLISPNDLRFDTLDRAIDELDRVTPKLKQHVIQACARCIAADREVTTEEAELFRAIGEALGCPVPPLLPGQDLA